MRLIRNSLIISIVGFSCVACSTGEVLYRPLGPTVTKLASEMKSAGGQELVTTFNVVYATKVEAGLPVAFIPSEIGSLGFNREETTDVKVTIKDLQKWQQPPSRASLVPTDGIYRIERGTGKATRVQ